MLERSQTVSEKYCVSPEVFAKGRGVYGSEAGVNPVTKWFRNWGMCRVSCQYQFVSWEVLAQYITRICDINLMGKRSVETWEKLDNCKGVLFVREYAGIISCWKFQLISKFIASKTIFRSMLISTFIFQCLNIHSYIEASRFEIQTPYV